VVQIYITVVKCHRINSLRHCAQKTTDDKKKTPLSYHNYTHFLHSDLLGGWATFTVSICTIGMLTAVIGDVASHFGCTVGLKDAVTALSFVAMGTSIPGRFSIWEPACRVHTCILFFAMGTSITGRLLMFIVYGNQHTGYTRVYYLFPWEPAYQVYTLLMSILCG